MISKLKFQDIKMFKGNHSIEFKPLTIFTGTNNSGKSTLISLTGGMISQYGDYVCKISNYIQDLFPLSAETSGTYEGKYQDSSDIYYLRNLYLDGISSSFYKYKSILPESIVFCYKEEPIIVFDPNPSTISYEEFYYTITIDFEKLFSVLSSQSTHSENEKKTLNFLNKYLQIGFPKELYNTYLIDERKNVPLFTLMQKSLKYFNINIYDYSFSNITNTESNGFLLFYFNAIYNSIRNNVNLVNEFSKDFHNCLKFVLNEVILFPLHKQANNFKALINLSPYRGVFVNETNSKAYEILTDIIHKESQLKNEHQRKSYQWYRKSLYHSGFEKDKITSRIEFLKKWINEFNIGKDIKFVKSPKNHLTISQQDNLIRYPFELGFGNQQFLPILLAFCNPNNGLFLIEEPESHMHPNLQSKLADFFIDAINTYPGVQFIIETHSEYLIRKLQFLIAKGLVDKDQVALYYCHNANSIPPNCSQIQRMEFRDDGIIKQEFGTGFFDESATLAINLLNIKNLQ